MNKLVLMMLMFSTSVYAEKSLNSVILDRATLFIDGAELHAKTKVKLKKGENRVLLKNISNQMNLGGIQVGFENAPGVKILSIDLRDPFGVISTKSDEDLYDNSDLDNDNERKEIKELLDKKQKLEAEYQATEVKFAAVSETIALLQSNHIEDLVKNSTNRTQDMKDILDFVRTNLTTALTEQAALQKKLEELNAQVGNYDSKLSLYSKFNAGNVSANNIIGMKVYSDSDITVPLSLSYRITNDMNARTGWSPSYTIDIKDSNSPLQLTYKANLFQSSGLDWHDIDFTLSSESAKNNELSTIYYDNFAPPNLDKWNIKVTNRGKAAEKTVTAVAGDLSDDIEFYDEMRIEREDKENPNTTYSDLNFTYNVKLPSPLKSRSNYMVDLETKAINAEYLYLSTPKLDSSVYLQASIPNWKEVNLLPGSVLLTYMNNFVGYFQIKPTGNEKSLSFILGKDKDISVTRTRDLNEIAPASGNKVSQKYGYTITLKNSKSSPIDMMVNDQLPVASSKNVLVEDAKYEGATYEKESGKLSWRFSVQPHETKTIHFSFKLTYPKDKKVTGL